MQSIELLENEQLDNLELCGLKIIQKKDGFKYGTDAVLLSDFAKDIPSQSTLDLCSGTGIIPFLLYGKSKTRKFTAVEIQEDMAEMAQRSVELNELTQNISIICADLKDSVRILGKRQFDLITCNPPYLNNSIKIMTRIGAAIAIFHQIILALICLLALFLFLLPSYSIL